MMVLFSTGLRQIDGEAAQDEQGSQRHDKAGQPGADHDEAVDCAHDQHADGKGHAGSTIQTGQPRIDQKMAIIMPEKPIIEPTDKVELARDHQQAGADRDNHELGRDDWLQFMMPWRIEHAAVEAAKSRKKVKTATVPTMPPELGPYEGLRAAARRSLTRSSSIAGGRLSPPPLDVSPALILFVKGAAKAQSTGRAGSFAMVQRYSPAKAPPPSQAHRQSRSRGLS